MTKANKNRQTQPPKNSSPKPNRAPKRTLHARPKARSSPKVAAGQCARQAKSADAEIDSERQELYAAIEREWTPKVQKAVLNFARKRVNMMASAGIPIQSSHAKHLMTDALSDTALGRVVWNRQTVPLRSHLFAVLRSRTANAMHRANRFPHSDITLNEMSSWESGNPFTALSLVRTLHRCRQQLRELSVIRGDQVALGILDQYERGVEGRSEIAHILGVSLREYDRARERLGERVRRLAFASKST